MPLKPTVRAEVTTIDVTTSGNVANIGIDQNASVPKITASLSTDISSIDTNMTAEVSKTTTLEETINVDNLSFSTTPTISKSITANTGYISGEHAALRGLDYEHSGHTGFASQTELQNKQNQLTLGNTMT